MPSPPECVQTACSKQQGQVILGSSYEWGEKVCLLNYSVYVWVGGCVCVFVCVCARVPFCMAKSPSRAVHLQSKDVV